MKILVILLGLCIVQGSNVIRKRQVDYADPQTKNSVVCVVNCMKQMEQKGVDGPVETPAPLENGCNSLDFRELVGLCKGYRKADECIKLCPNDATKKIMIEGLNYVCIERFADFQKYTPCFNKQCEMIESECSPRCGTLEEAADDWFSEIKNATEEVDLEKEERKRRKRDADLYQTTTPSESFEDTEETEGTRKELVKLGFLDTCNYVNCYINCSRPRMTESCGQEATDLLSYIAHMLFSFLVAPYKDVLVNTNVTEIVSDGCDVKSLILTRKLALTSAAPNVGSNWSMITSTVILFIVAKMRN